jgi:N-acetylglucosamine kinase-like BadF-type ATPase
VKVSGRVSREANVGDVKEFAVGVDAGGTSTVVACSAARGDEPFIGRAAGANPTSHGVEAAADTIAGAVRSALPADAAIAALYVGAAGAGSVNVAIALVDALSARLPGIRSLCVGDDAEIGFRAAIPEGPGVAILAGTGSVAYGENGSVHVRVGGAGYLLGDEGSAFAIGFAAVRLLARAYDDRARGDETTRLVERVLDVSTRFTLLERIYGPAQRDVSRIAALAPSIVAFAGKGNRASRAIVERAAQELAELGRAAVEQCALGPQPRIALGGGLLREPSLLRDLVVDNLKAFDESAHIVFAPVDDVAPARAALARAFALAAARS